MIIKNMSSRLFAALLTALIDLAAVAAIFFMEPLLIFVRKTSVQCMLSPLGLKCGVCGGTHCMECLMSGDISGALRSNLILPFLILFLLVLFIFANLALIFNIASAKKLLFKYLLRLHSFIIFGVSFIIYMVVRNIIAI